MSQSPTLPVDQVPPTKRQSLSARRLFFPLVGALLLALGFIGFGRFFLQGQAYPGRAIAPPIRTLVIVHGITMSGWLLLMVTQPLLIMRRKHRVHMALGKLGALLALLIVILGLMVAMRSAAVTPPDALIWGLSPKQFMAVPFISILIFAAFVSLGVIYRRKPAIHRSMMLLATLSAMAAAISRIDPLNSVYLGTVWERLFGPFFLTLVLSVLLLLARWAITRSFERWFAIGVGCLILASALIMQIAPTQGWVSFASLFLP